MWADLNFELYIINRVSCQFILLYVQFLNAYQPSWSTTTVIMEHEIHDACYTCRPKLDFKRNLMSTLYFTVLLTRVIHNLQVWTTCINLYKFVTSVENWIFYTEDHIPVEELIGSTGLGKIGPATSMLQNQWINHQAKMTIGGSRWNSYVSNEKFKLIIFVNIFQSSPTLRFD